MAAASPVLRDVSLDDKYALESGRVYLTGAQAFVRLLILQRQRDVLAGLNTGGLRLRLSRLAARRARPVAVEGGEVPRARAHQVPARIERGPRRDRVVGIAAGQPVSAREVRRRVRDVVRQGPRRRPLRRRVQARESRRHVEARRRAGAGRRRPRREVVDAAAPVRPPVLGGADPGALSVVACRRSSTSACTAGRCRATPGCWVGFKCVADTVESSSSVYIDPERTKIIVPDDFPMPPDGLSIRWPDGFLETEARMQDYKVYAALHYCRVNQLNRIVIDSPKPRLGIITSGKSYLDVRQALDDLGITEADAAEIGLRVYKIAMTWPLEPEGVRQFAEGLEEILVVEEKRQIVEYQLKEQLYNWRDDVRPRVVGKFDEKGEWVRPHGDWLLPALSELTPGDDRARDRAAHPPSQPASARDREAQRARRLDQREGEGAREAEDHARAHPVLLLRLPAQHVDQRARGQPRHRRHRLPRDGDLDGPPHVDVHAHGRRRRAVDRPGAVHRREAHLREPGRRHLLPQRQPRDPRGGRRQGQHHLQDPLQRRGRDDRRPAVRRPAHAGRHRAARSPPKASPRSSSSPTSPDKYPSGYFAERHRDPRPRRARRRPAQAARHARLHGAALRPDLRGREAAPEEARQVSRSGEARGHQRARLRGLRRLRRQVELRVGRAGRDRVRPQAHDRPELVQQGLLVREGLLPELRHRRRRHAAEAEEGGGGRVSRLARSRAAGRPPSPTASWSPASAAPAW